MYSIWTQLQHIRTVYTCYSFIRITTKWICCYTYNMWVSDSCTTRLPARNGRSLIVTPLHIKHSSTQTLCHLGHCLHELRPATPKMCMHTHTHTHFSSNEHPTTKSSFSPLRSNVIFSDLCPGCNIGVPIRLLLRTPLSRASHNTLLLRLSQSLTASLTRTHMYTNKSIHVHLKSNVSAELRSVGSHTNTHTTCISAT